MAENYGYYAGGKDWQRDISLRLIDQAIACKAKTLLVPECGHAYTALRWEAADLYGKPLPFKVRHVTEFLAEELAGGPSETDAGQPPARPLSMILVSLVRKGGVNDAPRALMKAMGIELERNEESRRLQFLLRRWRRRARYRARGAFALPHHGEQAARNRRHRCRDLS